MSYLPISGASGTYVIAAGTTVLSDSPAVFRSLILAGTFVGSVELYDSATAAGTAAGNNLYNVGLPLTNAYKNIDFNQQTRRGLTVVATGTPIIGITWDK